MIVTLYLVARFIGKRNSVLFYVQYSRLVTRPCYPTGEDRFEHVGELASDSMDPFDMKPMEDLSIGKENLPSLRRLSHLTSTESRFYVSLPRTLTSVRSKFVSPMSDLKNSPLFWIHGRGRITYWLFLQHSSVRSISHRVFATTQEDAVGSAGINRESPEKIT